ncbi:MAG: hypothetical protein ACOYJ1_10760 [Peptococcales bacterium]
MPALLNLIDNLNLILFSVGSVATVASVEGTEKYSLKINPSQELFLL